jgi:hypothetical protein
MVLGMQPFLPSQWPLFPWIRGKGPWRTNPHATAARSARPKSRPLPRLRRVYRRLRGQVSAEAGIQRHFRSSLPLQAMQMVRALERDGLIR